MEKIALVDWSVIFQDESQLTASVTSTSNISSSYEVKLVLEKSQTPTCSCGMPRTHQSECVHIIACYLSRPPIEIIPTEFEWKSMEMWKIQLFGKVEEKDKPFNFPFPSKMKLDPNHKLVDKSLLPMPLAPIILASGRPAEDQFRIEALVKSKA